MKRIVNWFRHETGHQQVARLFGYAGCGKSTILRFHLEELGLSTSASSRHCVPDVVTATFTGKAALVLRRKGTPARTIHSLIYSVIQATEEEVEAAAKKIAGGKELARGLTGFDRPPPRPRSRPCARRCRDEASPLRAKPAERRGADAKLIVLDEVSMVGEDMARDLMSFKKPILVLGDPGQLPPIKGEGAFTRDAPDVMLTEIHRQAEESAIIRLATMARQGEPSASASMTPVAKMRKMDVTPEQALRGGQVICGLNATRLQLNNAMRAGRRLRRQLSADRPRREDHLPQEPERSRSDQWHVHYARGHRR